MGGQPPRPWNSSALAKANRLVTAVGLQARVNPALMHMKELIEAGYVGEMMAVHVSLLREGVLSRPSNRTWQRDAELGANTLTIANGHTVDAMRFVAGDFGRLSAVVATQAKQWLDTGTGTLLDVTSPDNMLLSGRLANGAVASVHVGAIPFAGSGYRMEIYGRDGTLVASGEDSPQLSEVVLHGAKGGNTLEPMAVPERFSFAAPGTPPGEAANVGQMYTLFAQAIRGGDKSSADLRDRGRTAPPDRHNKAGVRYRSLGRLVVTILPLSVRHRLSVNGRGGPVTVG